MAARLALKLRPYEQFTAAMGWKTQADAAKALDMSEVQLYRIRHGIAPPSGKFIAGLLALAMASGKWDFHDLITVLNEDDEEVQVPAEQSVA